jgi:hypothetical protein
MWPVDQQAAHFYMPSATLLMSMATLIVGLVLWAMGAKLLRTVCTAASIVIGGAIGYLVARQMGAQQMIGLWVMGGALLGLILSWTLFMLWVCAGTGAILAAIVPAVVLIWHGMEIHPPDLAPTSSAYRAEAPALVQWPDNQGFGPDQSFEWGESDDLDPRIHRTNPQRNSQAGQQIPEYDAPWHELDEVRKPAEPDPSDRFSQYLQPGVSPGITGSLVGQSGERAKLLAGVEAESVGFASGQESFWELPDDQPEHRRMALLDQLVISKFGPQVDRIVSWWTGLDPNLRQRLMFAAAAGALVGVFGGLLLPNISAACVSSFAGAFLILVGTGGLLMRLAPKWNQSIEPYPAVTVLILLLVTAGGACLQYRSLRKTGN